MPRRERRIRRSNSTGRALTFQLQTCAERSGVDAMILADAQGLVVASSPWHDDATAGIAATLANIQEHQFRVVTVRDESGPPRTIAARGFQAGEERLVVCAVGCPSSQTVDELYTAMGGIRRILGA